MGERGGALGRAPGLFGRKAGGAISAILTVALAALLAGCAGIKTDYQIATERAKAYVAAHPDLPANVAGAILANEIRNGMTMEQVIAAWGHPVVVQRFRGGTVQYWFFGCDWPHFCLTAERVLPEPDEIYRSRALFQDGVVVDWGS